MIINLTKKKILAQNPKAARSFAERGRGMIGRNFENFDAMVFDRCNCIHTLLMSITIDVLFVNRDNVVCELRKSLKPWRPFIRSGKAISVIELPQGAIEKSETKIGDVLNLNAEVTQEREEELKQKILSTPEVAISMNCPPVIGDKLEFIKNGNTTHASEK